MTVKEMMQTRFPEMEEQKAEQFSVFYDFLLDWNSRINLTAITEPDAVVKKHFADSIAASYLIPKEAECIDVGTGAGFPGIPLLIVRDDIRVTLLDSLNKRLIFLQEIVKELGLSGRTEIIHTRAEDAGRNPAYRARYDISLSRAVASLPVLMELTVPLLKKGGTSICYKGEPQEEILQSENAAKKLFCSIRTENITSDYGTRTLVLVKKEQDTPTQYPRKAGTPEKKPL